MKKAEILQIINENIDDDIRSEYNSMSIDIDTGTILFFNISEITDMEYKSEYMIIWEHPTHHYRKHYIPYNKINYISFDEVIV